ncbi:branched-chain amino acid ABC transporter permease [Mesorhizobium sp. YM1C-6-2]|uniref:branched-chain amino acid ABC transporter permease n=1 Tax=Mesorhizobium sp. YM1C-6-2 TaxID=1827501 RepID=UPI000EF1D200|nr:branched-chain amino acid ABC transporter permease [Mesorhizobium sp. YM1C-6-2]RLP26717.1 branched-chain amino acid ABC transporter permease [Mesorhizobium sp. YM1C-6-2]
MLYFLQQLLNGLHSGALYALLAFGYVLTNGVLKRTNLAYGPIFAFAGQVLIIIAVFGWNVLWLTLPATVALGILLAFLYAALTASLLARSVYIPLALSSPNAIVVATLGVAIVLMELARIAADTRDLWLPPILAAPVMFLPSGRFPVTLTVIQVIDCVLAVAVIVLAGSALSRSQFGRSWRAVSDDPAAAAMCGVDVRRVFQAAVVGGALLAALAGSMAALYYGNISFGSGMVYGLKVLFVTAAGSYRDPSRAAAGAACFGIAESLWTGYFPIEWRDAWMFAFLAALLVLTRTGREDDRATA